MRLVPLVVSMAALAVSLLPGTAQAEAGSDDRSGGIVVTARLAKTARTEQQLAPNLVTIQSAETIAKYPDINAAEALSRMPGVALSIDTSEGRFVNIRGLDGNLDGATIGGVVLLNTQPGGTYFNSAARAVEFDTVPIGAVDRITVIKTGLPDHDAEGIGGTVELTPRTAVGLSHLFADVMVAGGVETFKDNPFYRDEIVVGGPIDKAHTLSFMLTQYLHNDRRAFHDIEAGYIDGQPAVPDKAFGGLELRNYDYHRQRFGYSGEFDYVPADGQRYYLRASYAGYNEHVYRNRFEIDFDGNAAVNPANANGLMDTATAVKTLRDEDETHKNLVVQLGGDNHWGKAHVEYWGAYSRASYDKHFDYNSTFANPNGYTIAYDNTTNPNYPSYSVASGNGLLDPSLYALTSITNAAEHDRDQEWSGAASIGLPVGVADNDEVKFGAKLRFRHKVANPFTGKYGYPGSLTLAQGAAGGAITNFYGSYNIMPNISGAPLRTIFDQSGTSLTLNTGGFFDDDEDVTAGFIQYKGDLGQLGVLAGLRFEHTSATYRGIGAIVSGTGAAATTTTGPISTAHRYDNVFPTVQLRYAFRPTLLLRATYSTGFARPGFYQTQQNTSVDTGAQTASTGNPNLLPTYSHNFDLALEYYLPDAGIVSLGVFDKEMLDYIVTRGGPVTNYAGTGNTYVVQSYQNARHAHARGIEANFVDHFRGLPGLLGGLGVDANLAYVDSGVAVRADQPSVALPGAFAWSWNAAVFWEKGKTKLRLASQFESSVLFGVGGSRATDVFQDSRTTLDFNGSYEVTDRVQVFCNAKNLTNAPLRFYEGTPSRPIQREYYDVTLESGVKLKF